jgi:hypothetical protein
MLLSGGHMKLVHSGRIVGVGAFICAVSTCARTVVFAFVVAVASSSCNRSPVAPAGQPSVPSLTSVRVSGPTSIAPGETARYTASAEYSDGSSKDVTNTASWWPESDKTWFPIHFTSPGVALGANRGEVNIAARVDGKVAYFHVLVLESGTFKLGGVVSEPGGGSLEGVTVEVLSGTGRGLQARTDGQGRYALYGVAGLVRLHASADGFTPQDHDVVVTSNDAMDSFALTTVERPADVSGVWTMTVEPSPSCRAGLPDIAHGRTYQVQLIQQGTRLQVRTSSPTLQVFNPDGDYGTIFGSHVRLHFVGDTDYGDWSTPDLYDHLSPTEKFGFDGSVDGTVTGSEIRGTMNGDLVYWNAPTYGPAWYCRATDHGVILRR